MAGIALLLPSEAMCRQAELFLDNRKHHVIINKATTIDNVVEEARKAVEAGANIIVARGHQVSEVKLYTGIPTVEVVMTAQELGLLVVKAKKMIQKPVPKIGLFYWKGMLCDTTYFEQLYEVQLVTFELDDSINWFDLVESGISEGMDILIGGKKCVRYALQKGIPALYLSTTGESVEIAINNAETMYDMAEFEKHSYAQFSTVLDNSFNGIIKVSTDGIVETMNRVMEELLDIHEKDGEGHCLSELLPSLDPDMTMKIMTGEIETYSTFISNEKNAMVVIMDPIVVDNRITGAIISCNRTTRLEWSEDKMREKFLAGFIAHENFGDLLNVRPGLKEAIELAKIYAQSSSPILVESRSGEEAELFCQSIHNYSQRKYGPYVVINMSSISKEQQIHALFGITSAELDKNQPGALVKANDGTLVIRGFDKLTMLAQHYLLCVIRKKRFGISYVENESMQRVDTRIIACTSKELKEFVGDGHMKKELYYMLKAFCITLPDAALRKKDLEIQLDSYYRKYLEKYSRYHVLTQDAKERILNFSWDNNDIQLESFCERMILTAGKRKLSAEYVQYLLDSLYDLTPEGNVDERTEIPVIEQKKKQEIQDTLLKYNGNRMMTAKTLGISTSTLWRYIKKYHINE